MTERIESVKAGITAAVVFGLAETGMIFAHSYLGFQINPLFYVSHVLVSPKNPFPAHAHIHTTHTSHGRSCT